MPSLTITAPDGTSSMVSWREGTIGIGRESSNHVVLDHEKVARWHAAIFEDPGPSYRLRDLGSPSGVWFGKERIRSRVLQEGDEFSIGPFRVAFAARESGSADTRSGHELCIRFGERSEDPLGDHETSELNRDFDWSRFDREGAADEASPRRLFEAVRSVAGRLDLDEMLECLLDHVDRLVTPSVGFTALVAGDGSLDILARRARFDGDPGAKEIRVSQSIAGRAIQSGQAVVARSSTLLTGSMQDLRIVRAACLPLVADGRVRGIVYADWRNWGQPPLDENRLEWVAALVLYAGSALENALHHHGLRARHERLQQARRAYTQLVGVSADVRRLIKEADLCAGRDLDVLVLGPTGTGKELVARRIHERSRRGDAPFVAVNCASIPRDLFETEMFGHVRGAFTGASTSRIGRFREANGGTIFLDEFAELNPDHQARLLRVLEDRTVTPVGGKSEPVDVRIIAATNRDLKQALEERTLREDLYHRLGFTIRTTPLKRRLEDLPILAYYLLDRHTQAQGEPFRNISPKVMEAFFLYAWPGNVRELGRTLRNALVMAGNVIQPGDIQRDLENSLAEDLASLEEIESDHIRRVLQATGGNQGRAARILGVAPNTLKAKMDRYDIRREDSQR